MSALNAAEPEDLRVERHASWAELFFDLVAVAGVGALAHVLEAELDGPSLGLYALLFLSFWLSWTTFMLYGNVAAGQTRVIRLLVGMFGLGVMAASVPGVAHTVLEEGHSTRPLTVFTIAYMATRIYGAQSWRRGEILLDFPVVQYSIGLVPWLISIWVDEPWKLTLWAVGVGLDLLLIVVLSGDKMLKRIQAYLAELPTPAQRLGPNRHRRNAGPDEPDKDGAEEPPIRGVSVDPVHLSERLGLFVIIVLGESVMQVVDAAGQAPYGTGLLTTGLASFLLLAGIFGLSVVFGYAGLPHLRAGRIPARAALGLHCLVTGVVATVAVSLAAVIEHGHEPLPNEGRWLLCGAVAAYFALGVVTGIASHSADLKESAARFVTGVLIPLLLALFAVDAGARGLVIYLVLVVMAHLAFEARHHRQDASK